MDNYSENEIKILNVDVENLTKCLVSQKAKLVFSGERVIHTFDDNCESYRNRDILIRLTDEASTKLTVHINNTSTNRQIIKLHMMESEMTIIDFLSALGLSERTRLRAYRTSFELEGIDFDIDQFPNIPPFLEIDIANLNYSLDILLFNLGLKNNQIVTCGTEEIFKLYGFDYYSLFSIN